MIDYAKSEESCFEVVDNKIALKKSVITIRCKCSWQLLGIPGVIFFYARQDSFQQKIYFDKSFWLVNKCKLEMFYSKVVVKELLREMFILLKFDTETHIKLIFNIPFEKFQ